MKKEYSEVRGETYYKQLNYEAVLSAQINRIAVAYSNRDMGSFICGVEALVTMLPIKQRDEVKKYMEDNNITYGLTDAHKDLYRGLWSYTHTLLQEANLIFREGKGADEYGIM